MKVKRLLLIVAASAAFVIAIFLTAPAYSGSSGLDLYYCPKCEGHHPSGHPHFQVTPPKPPPKLTPTPRQLAIPVHNEAVDYCNAGKWLKAIERLQKALEIDETYAKARDLLKKVQDLYNKELANAAYNRAVDRYNNGEWSLAISELEKALNHNPDDPEAKEFLQKVKDRKTEDENFKTAMIYYRKNDMNSALKYLLEASKHNPDSKIYEKYLDNARRQITSKLLGELIRELRDNRDGSTLSFRTLGGVKPQISNTLSFNQLRAVRSGDLSFDNLGTPPGRSIDVLPPIREKQYMRIDPKGWSEELKPHIELTNEKLAEIQKAADKAGRATADWLKMKVYSAFTAKIPGYKFYSTLKGQVKELNEMFGSDRVDMAEQNLDFFRRSVNSVGGVGGESASYDEVTSMLEGRKKKYDGFVRKKIKSDIKKRWKKDTAVKSDNTRRVVPIEKVPAHPDLRRWNFHKWSLQSNLLRQQ